MNPSNWTLRQRLVALIVVLFMAIGSAIGAALYFNVRANLLGQVDGQLQNAAHRLQMGPAVSFDQDGDFGTRGFEAGTITAGLTSSLSSGGYLDDTGTHHALTSQQLDQLKAVSPAGSPETVQLADLGAYRATALTARTLPPTSSAATLVVAVPLYDAYNTLRNVLLALTLVTLAGILVAAVASYLLVGRALRSLRRVAHVASDVSRMRLDEGDVDLAERVPTHDTNPHTEVGQVGAALNGLLDTVGTALGKRQASEAKLRTFVADASHELRTPLASIRGYAELTRRFGGPLGEDARHNIDRIESESKRMTSLVEDLLLLARLDAQRELDEADVDLSRLLVDVVSDAHAAGRDHQWDLDLPDEPVIVRGDDARLHQVFTNLLANARVHTPAGTRVIVELRPPAPDDVTVLVRDSGPGIPEQLQPTLFERFVRGDSSRNRSTGSTGLGLSIVSAVVQAHHGSVSVESKPGETVFAVRLPVHYVAEAPAPAPALPAEPVPA